MRIRQFWFPVALLLTVFLVSTGSAQIRDHSASSSKGKSGAKSRKPPANGFKPFAELTKDKEAVEGLFTFYRDTTDNSVLMTISPEQIGPYFLCNTAKSSAEGAYYDTGPLGRSFPFYFVRVGKNILMMEKNLLYRADSTSSMKNALEHGISDHLVATLPIKSEPRDSTKAILVDPEELFIRDADNVSYFLGQRLRLGVSFDSKNSYYLGIKSFPGNSEIDIRLHFKASHNLNGATLQNGQSFFHIYHYSISSLPETDYKPRLADSRIGYFMTQYQDYTSLDGETPYVRYIERWNLKKKNPDARISEPVEPIVYWIDKATPPEYRDAIAEGIEFWNASFEKIGFRSAIIAKQMPDTADWDPLDTRYSTIRWMVSPGATYAIGPSRANPFTGQIYDADISVSADLMRYFFNLIDEFVKPVSADGRILDDDSEPELNEGMQFEHNDRYCDYAKEMVQEVAFGLSYLLAAEGSLADKDTLTREYIHGALVEFVAHEVGHTLGFRHNFKASSIYTLEQLRDRNFTRVNSTGGTIMDYNPPLISEKDQQQGEFFASVPGPFDNLLIEYGYAEFGDITPEDEAARLHEIASRTSQPTLAFATDFDLNAFQVDPMVERHDMGPDPIAYCDHKINLTQELWTNAIKEFEKPGISYEKIRRVFQNGWRSYTEAARYVPRVVGGLYHSKGFIGDPGGTVPFTPVPASEQRRAVQFVADRIFAPSAFNVPAELLNKLQPTRDEDFDGSVYSTPIAYQWHERVLNIQARAVDMLYMPRTVARLLNNLSRVSDGAERYTMYDMFTQLREEIWSELNGPANVNSFRRQLQLYHLRRLTVIYLSNASVYPVDALTLAGNDLDLIEAGARAAMTSNRIDGMSKAHFKEVVRQIEAAKSAQRDFIGY
jgi:hypothetical protein